MEVSGEKEFRGQGVSHCSTCDDPLFQGQEVAVAGGENASLETALHLARYCSKVYIISLRPWVANDFLKEIVESEPKIVSLTGYQITEIKGQKFVEEIVIKNFSTVEKNLSVKGSIY